MPTYAYSYWIFKRALSLIYVIAFISVATQVLGLCGEHGILPIAEYLKSLQVGQGTSFVHLFLKAPSLFWISTSDSVLVAAAWIGALAGVAAFLGWAEGWMFLLCFILYVSFRATGQRFLAYQWDSLLVELGFLTVFVTPWRLSNSFFVTREPRKVMRFLFYLVLFKLMFTSGVAKTLSGAPNWSDFTALSYHYWTQPLPNPISPFMYALPLWVHRFSTLMTFVIELGFPFFILWPRTRVLAASGFIVLSLMIFTTGNFAFFNWLVLALCTWLIPDHYWRRLFNRLNPKMMKRLTVVTKPRTVSPGLLVFAGVMALFSILWIARSFQPRPVDSTSMSVYAVTKALGISTPLGIFATITTSRPEVVIEGSEDGVSWKEYEFHYRPGPLDRSPPFIAPFQPRIDWQLWFAGLATYHPNPWFDNFMNRVLEGSPNVLAFFSKNPFPDKPPNYLRASRYEYEFNRPSEILSTGLWWRRTYLNQFSPIYKASIK